MNQEVRAGTVDDSFTEPSVDIDEWRDAPVRHRYVHGGFAKTDTLFSIYLPPPEQYEGRFFQHITPVPDSETSGSRSDRRAGQDRLLDRERRVLPGDERRRQVGQSGVDGGPHHRRVPGQRRRGAVLAASSRRRCTATTDPTGTPTGAAAAGTARSAEPRTPPASGTASSRTSSVRRWPSRTCSPFACTPSGCYDTSFDQIVDAVEPGGSGDMFEGLDARGARGPHRGDPDGLPATLVVRPPHDGDARVPGAVSGRASWPTPRTSRTSGPSPATSVTRRRLRSSETSCSIAARWSRRSATTRRRSSVSDAGPQPGQPGAASTPRGAAQALPRPSPSRSVCRAHQESTSWEQS